MASYKIPQDVEADDKLIGPFSFRQFIYLIVVTICLFLAWALSKIFLALGIIPLPLALVFLILALPLRKDQPMEVYAAAVVSFWLRPKQRLWEADGTMSFVEITAPPNSGPPPTKGFGEEEAHERLSYLSQLVDSEGWASRGLQANPHQQTQASGSNLHSDVVSDADAIDDMLDVDSQVGQKFDTMITESTAQHRQAIMQNIKQSASPAPTSQVAMADDEEAARLALEKAAELKSKIEGNTSKLPSKSQDAPAEIKTPSSQPPQAVKPAEELAASSQKLAEELPSQTAAPKSSQSTPSADIIKLANNPDLSIETIAREANRIDSRKAKEGDEVVLQLH